MSLINVSLNVVAYADEPKSSNPQVKFADLYWSLQGLPTETPKQIPINLTPGESQTIMSTARSLAFTPVTTFDVVSVAGTTNVRLVGDFGARTARDDGDATTEWEITRTNSLVRLRYTGTGTAPNFGTMQNGNGVTLGTSFAAINRGDFVVVRVGADFVEFTNAIASNETVTAQVEIYSSGPVQIGDSLDLTSSQFSYPNRGQFEILSVTDSYIEFSNPDAIPETGVTTVVGGLFIYPQSFKWCLIVTDRRTIARLNGDTGSGVEIEPPVDDDIVSSPGLFLKRGKVFELELENPNLEILTGVVFLAE